MSYQVVTSVLSMPIYMLSFYYLLYCAINLISQISRRKLYDFHNLEVDTKDGDGMIYMV